MYRSKVLSFFREVITPRYIIPWTWLRHVFFWGALKCMYVCMYVCICVCMYAGDLAHVHACYVYSSSKGKCDVKENVCVHTHAHTKTHTCAFTYLYGSFIRTRTWMLRFKMRLEDFIWRHQRLAHRTHQFESLFLILKLWTVRFHGIIFLLCLRLNIDDIKVTISWDGIQHTDSAMCACQCTYLGFRWNIVCRKIPPIRIACIAKTTWCVQTQIRNQRSLRREPQKKIHQARF